MKKKTIIFIPDDLFQVAEQFAHNEGMSRSELYATALRKYLEEHAAANITAQLDELYSTEPSNPDPAIVQAQIDILPRDEWE